MAYNCDGHPDRYAAITITNLEIGEVAAYCQECVPAVIFGMAEVFGAKVVLPGEAGYSADPDTGDVTDKPEGEPEHAPGTAPARPSPGHAADPDDDDDDDDGGFTAETVDRALDVASPGGSVDYWPVEA